MAAFAQVLAHAGILKGIAEQVRFARARFGQYNLTDFVAVLIGSFLYRFWGILARLGDRLLKRRMLVEQRAYLTRRTAPWIWGWPLQT